MKKIGVVVVNYNGKKVLSHCLRSLFASQYRNFEVIVVDNASTDDPMAGVRSDFPKARSIFLAENKGFAGGVNVGIVYALEHGADFVFLLNNDACVFPDTLSVLMQYAQQQDRAVFSPYVYKANQKEPWFCGGEIQWFRMRAVHQKCRKGSHPFQTQYLSGCALFIPKKAFFDAGLFDEEYFLYYEDADWSVRATQAEYSLWMVPLARVKHTEQSDRENPFKLYFLVYSGLLFFQKNASKLLFYWGFF